MSTAISSVSSCRNISPTTSWFILNDIDFTRFLMYFWCSHVIPSCKMDYRKYPCPNVPVSQFSVQNLGNLENFYFLKSSSVKSRDVKCHPWSFLIPQEVSIRVLVHFQEYCFLMISGGFLVFSGLESGSHPSYPQYECPKYPCEEISIRVLMIFDVASNCVHPRF